MFREIFKYKLNIVATMFSFLDSEHQDRSFEKIHKFCFRNDAVGIEFWGPFFDLREDFDSNEATNMLAQLATDKSQSDDFSGFKTPLSQGILR
ncbi:MAG: hypothetical protein C5B49_13025 [Bdellovibrio sp.]|nr:MAG: hypothetical protein C5B49_13025 [Bdellovibrio sp.]